MFKGFEAIFLTTNSFHLSVSICSQHKTRQLGKSMDKYQCSIEIMNPQKVRYRY